ncbi:uncharacterized protein LOC135479492 [Liolophura sinensis]|uniref:uncharacterized protein LOC135479492 n=1 Tax=Liolophura sinensis TaxID=3198878 RepID=UPI003158C536
MTSCRKCSRDVILWHTACILLICSCPVILLAVGFGVVTPYMYTRQFSGRKSTCTVRTVWRHPSVDCHCGYRAIKTPVCRSLSPCVEIRVNYVNEEKFDVVRDAMLYDDPYMYGVLKNERCSTQSCEKDASSNNKTVNEFIRNYGAIGHTFLCYPGRDSHPEVLLSLIRGWRVYLGMIIPGVLFLAAVISEACYLLVYPRYKKKRRKRKQCNSAHVDADELTLSVTRTTGNSHRSGDSYRFKTSNKYWDRPTSPNEKTMHTDKTKIASKLGNAKNGGVDTYRTGRSHEISEGGGKFGTGKQTTIHGYSQENNKYKNANRKMNASSITSAGILNTCTAEFTKSDTHRVSDISRDAHNQDNGEISVKMDRLGNKDTISDTYIW